MTKTLGALVDEQGQGLVEYAPVLVPVDERHQDVFAPVFVIGFAMGCALQ
jgi:hypothetical protein